MAKNTRPGLIAGSAAVALKIAAGMPLLRAGGAAVALKIAAGCRSYVRGSAAAALKIAAGMPLLLGVASAHHSFSAQYDADKQVTVRGFVTKVEWRNPHAYFYMDVDDGAGNVSQWAFEMGAPSVLQRRGWYRDSLKIGDIVEVNGALARDGSRLVNATAVLFPDSGERLTASDGPIGGTAVPGEGAP